LSKSVERGEGKGKERVQRSDYEKILASVLGLCKDTK
jgi:hypothetical protein